MVIDRGKLVTTVKHLARAAGAVYLLITLIAVIVQVSGHAGVDIPGLAADDAQHPMASTALPPPTAEAGAAMALAFAFVGATVYLSFRLVGRQVGGALSVYLVVGTGLLAINLLFHHAAMQAASASSADDLRTQTVNGLVSILLDLDERGYTAASVVLALCLLPLGSLAYRSKRLPRVIGALLVVSLAVSTLVAHAWPSSPALVHQALAPPPLADLWLVLYLVTKAGRVPRPTGSRPSCDASGRHTQVSSLAVPSTRNEAAATPTGGDRTRQGALNGVVPR